MKLRTTAALATAWTLAGGLTLAQSIINNSNTVTVSISGISATNCAPNCPQPTPQVIYSDLQSALNSITNASASNPYVILVYPGLYTGTNNGGNLRWKSYVSLRGVDRISTIIQGGVFVQGSIIPLIDATGMTGVEFSNITIDGHNLSNGGTQRGAVVNGEEGGSIAVCGATITFSNVTYINGGATTLGDSLVSGQDFVGQTCSTAGSVTVQDSDMAGILDGGGSWLIKNSNIHGIFDGAPVYAFRRFASGTASPSGTTTIIGSTLTATNTTSEPAYAVQVTGCPNAGPLRIEGSVLSAVSMNVTSAPDIEKTAILNDGPGSCAAGPILVEGSVLMYGTVNSGIGGVFYGVHLTSTSVLPIDLRGSVIRPVGPAGARIDVQIDGTGAAVTLAGVEYSSVGGVGASSIATRDFRQGQFSSDLTIPLAAPATAADGKLFVNSSNQLCYRSAGALYCAAGGGFMKVSQIGTSPASGNLVCITVSGTKREGQARVTIVNRDTVAPVSNATVTGNWSGATTQNGVTAVTNSSGIATFTSNQTAIGSIFAFTVTNVTHSPDFYDSSSNVETSDSTPTCN